MTIAPRRAYGPPGMRVTINGEEQDIADGSTVEALVVALGLRPERVAVERNRLVVKRATWSEARIEPGDRLELLTFVGGG